MQSNALVQINATQTVYEPVIIGGANRGARETIPILTEISRKMPLTATFVDPVPRRSVALVAQVRSPGLTARGIEGRIEEVLPRSEAGKAPVILHVDDPQVIAATLASVDLRARAVFTYLFVRLPSEQLLGIRSVLREGDEDACRKAVSFFERLGEIRARAGSAHVFGEKGRAEHAVVEPLYRQRWFGEHIASNLAHVLAGTRPDHDCFEVTTDGVTSLPLFFLQADAGWTPAAELAHKLVAQAPTAIVPGRSFMIAEIGKRGIKLHIARIRVTDGRVAVEDRAAVTPAGYAAAEAKRREEELRLALERARRETLSLTRPVWTSD